MSKITTCFLCLTLASSLFAHDIGDSESLSSAIKDAEKILHFTHDIKLQSPQIFSEQTITIDGNHFKLNGKGLFLKSGNITLKDLTFDKTSSIGGNGQSSGGGGLGAGGGIFVGKNSKVILQNCSFSSCSASGGAGAPNDPTLGSSSGGGGGMGGNGGTGIFNAGGGGGGFAEHGENATVGYEPGKGGGTGGDGQTSLVGNSGGYGGGGGGSPLGGGNGGFGGGGGGGASDGKIGGPGGNGGFGGGGGGANGEDGGRGGFGANPGTNNGRGGSGAGLGGAIFVEAGGELTIKDSVIFENNRCSSGQGNDIFMMSEGKITFDLTKDLVLENPVGGNIGKIAFGIENSDTTIGGLIKRGAARLELTGENTYTGRTIVEEGTLHLDGSLYNTVEVKEGAELCGSFKIQSLPSDDGDLINYGKVRPNNAEIAGSFINHPTGTLAVTIQPTGTNNNDTLKIQGKNAILNGGTLELSLQPGNYIAGTQFLIIDGPTTGAFDHIQTTGPLAGLLDFDTTYGSVIATVLNNRLFQDQLISASPARAVSRCITNTGITPGSDFARIVQELGTLSNSQVNKALTNLSPAQYGALELINARNNSYVVNLLSQYQFELCCSPRDCCNCECQTNIWINGFGNFINNHGRFGHLRPFEATGAGILAGIDYCFTPCSYIGASVGYTHTDLHWKHHGGKGEMDSYYGALYAIFKTCYFNIDLSFIGGGTEYDINRHIRFGTIDRRAKSDFWGYFLTSHLGLRGNWECSCVNLEPFALVDYHYWRREGFHEHRARSLNLDVRSKTQNLLRAEAGLKAYYSIICPCSCFAPFLGLSYVGEFPLHKSKQKANFVDQSCVFQATSYDDIINLGSPEVGLKWTHCNGFSFVVGYKGLFNTKTSINEVEGRLEWVF